MLLVCTLLIGGNTSARSQTGPATASAPEGTVVQEYARGLHFPVDMVHVPGTRKIFFTEKNTGQVRVMRKRRVLETPCVDLKVFNDGERGAAGITLHPNYATNHWLYVYFSSNVHDDNRIARFKVENNLCTNRKIIFEDIPTAPTHNGGQLEFLDGYLFVSTGDAQSAVDAQDTTGVAGKVLRLNANGSIPEGNPFDNAVWSYGHRNPFGLAARQEPAQLFESENGPTCADELNFIEEGLNYSWGEGATKGQAYADYQEDYCAAPPPQETPPLVSWGDGDDNETDPTIVPTDMVWYRGPLDAADDRLLMGAFKLGAIYSFNVDASGQLVGAPKVLHDGPRYVLDVARGPGGWVYYLTISGMYRIVETSAR
ncbi:MAG: PQQ-dependent sugar dehydrogenase [Actinomycetota bacterium]|nr:PQQ-dependent sugar dehydrogenase [Actinomycetota bacterium]